MLSSISLSLLLKYIAPIFVGQSQPVVLVNFVKDAWSVQLETIKKWPKLLLLLGGGSNFSCCAKHYAGLLPTS